MSFMSFTMCYYCYQTSAEEKNLKCYLTNNGHPLLLMQPVRVEVFHEKPFVAMFHNLMSDSEMELLKELAAPIVCVIKC